MVPIGYPRKPVRNYDYLISNNPEERSSHLLRGGSLKSRVLTSFPFGGEGGGSFLPHENEGTLPFETSGPTYPATQSDISEDTHRCENLKTDSSVYL
jgi:hypothetical protein